MSNQNIRLAVLIVLALGVSSTVYLALADHGMVFATSRMVKCLRWTSVAISLMGYFYVAVQ